MHSGEHLFFRAEALPMSNLVLNQNEELQRTYRNLLNKSSVEETISKLISKLEKTMNPPNHPSWDMTDNILQACVCGVLDPRFNITPAERLTFDLRRRCHALAAKMPDNSYTKYLFNILSAFPRSTGREARSLPAERTVHDDGVTVPALFDTPLLRDAYIESVSSREEEPRPFALAKAAQRRQAVSHPQGETLSLASPSAAGGVAKRARMDAAPPAPPARPAPAPAAAGVGRLTPSSVILIEDDSPPASRQGAPPQASPADAIHVKEEPADGAEADGVAEMDVDVDEGDRPVRQLGRVVAEALGLCGGDAEGQKEARISRGGMEGLGDMQEDVEDMDMDIACDEYEDPQDRKMRRLFKDVIAECGAESSQWKTVAEGILSGVYERCHAEELEGKTSDEKRAALDKRHDDVGTCVSVAIRVVKLAKAASLREAVPLRGIETLIQTIILPAVVKGGSPCGRGEVEEIAKSLEDLVRVEERAVAVALLAPMFADLLDNRLAQELFQRLCGVLSRRAVDAALDAFLQRPPSELSEKHLSALPRLIISPSGGVASAPTLQSLLSYLAGPTIAGGFANPVRLVKVASLILSVVQSQAVPSASARRPLLLGVARLLENCRGGCAAPLLNRVQDALDDL
ncbi:unnamed protein product [Vitrella brassicaformis CCMP3155]|uniref:Uncharacterized protein n=1 Tax=Vitrella brassicaformis (strain CCMP3155) TaxID=1169540 RepID=A0A0G4ECD3_VITBC|nr:unnamed protein product [Vitrella brassicaformis CCMP3155]|eukprot:CEL93367.1 unnamed protein product [Vitrella brassicaformis CCMP3155]